MSDEIEKIAKELIEQHKNVTRPDGRAHEIETALRIRLKRMAGRLDVGYHYSVRVGELPDASGEEGEETEAEREKKAEIITAIQKAASGIELKDLPGKPVLPLDWRPQSDALEDNQYSETTGKAKPTANKKKGSPKQSK